MRTSHKLVIGGGWNDSVATVTVPASSDVSRPPLIVLRVAQPEASPTAPSRTAKRKTRGRRAEGRVFIG